MTEAVSSDAETRASSRGSSSGCDQLEQELNLPSGDSIAAELTRFLKERDDDGAPGSEH